MLPTCPLVCIHGIFYDRSQDRLWGVLSVLDPPEKVDRAVLDFVLFTFRDSLSDFLVCFLRSKNWASKPLMLWRLFHSVHSMDHAVRDRKLLRHRSGPLT